MSTGSFVLRPRGLVAVAILASGWLGQGVRFGIASRAVVSVPLCLTSSTLGPWPGVLVAKILAWGLMARVASGALGAALAKGDSRILWGGTF